MMVCVVYGGEVGKIGSLPATTPIVRAAGRMQPKRPGPAYLVDIQVVFRPRAGSQRDLIVAGGALHLDPQTRCIAGQPVYLPGGAFGDTNGGVGTVKSDRIAILAETCECRPAQQRTGIIVARSVKRGNAGRLAKAICGHQPRSGCWSQPWPCVV